MAANQPPPHFGLSGGNRSGVTASPTPTGVPPAVTGANIVELDVPNTVAAGDSFTVSGRVHYNNIARPLTNTPVRIQVRGEQLTTISHQTDDLSHCNERPFSMDVPAIGQQGDTMSITVVSQSAAAGGWGDNETQGPFTVQIVSQQQQAVNTATDFAPWAIGGAAVGAGAASFTGRELTMGAAVGAGAGIGAKALTDQGGVLGAIGIPNIGVLEATALAALLGGGALFLGEVTELPLPGTSDVQRRIPSRGPAPQTDTSGA